MKTNRQIKKKEIQLFDAKFKTTTQCVNHNGGNTMYKSIHCKGAEMTISLRYTTLINIVPYALG